jgi:hypothetical protein
VIAVQPSEPFGPDVALVAQGAKASASSSTKWNPAANAIDGDAGAAYVGDLGGSPAWESAYGDANPELTVTFAHSERINRVLIATSCRGQHDAGDPQLGGRGARSVRRLARRR